MGSHEVGQGDLCVGLTEEYGTSLIHIGHTLAGEVVVGQQSAAVLVTFQSNGEQEAVELVICERNARTVCEIAEQTRPRIDVGGAVVAVHQREDLREW